VGGVEERESTQDAGPINRKIQNRTGPENTQEMRQFSWFCPTITRSARADSVAERRRSRVIAAPVA
jgi:hypothetical protein